MKNYSVEIKVKGEGAKSDRAFSSHKLTEGEAIDLYNNLVEHLLDIKRDNSLATLKFTKADVIKPTIKEKIFKGVMSGKLPRGIHIDIPVEIEMGDRIIAVTAHAKVEKWIDEEKFVKEK